MAASLYIHIPFCTEKCPYCFFVSYPLKNIDKKQVIASHYMKLVAAEIKRRVSERPGTIYIGGGTPSAISAKALINSLDAVPGSKWSECTVEANPETLKRKWLETLIAAGINRISIGVQSFDDTVLDILGRPHTAAQAKKAFTLARQSGIENISIDLMYGVPGQTMAQWRETVQTALSLEPQHISCYSLSYEEDTDFFRQVSDTTLTPADDEDTVDMYSYLNTELKKHGYHRYEISNFALPGYESKHNSSYWDGSPYIGVGLSAHSYQINSDGSRFRSWNTANIDDYLESIPQGIPAEAGKEKISQPMQLLENIMLSMRTSAGLHIPEVIDSEYLDTAKFKKNVQEFVEQGLIRKLSDDVIVISDSGIMRADTIIAQLCNAVHGVSGS